MVLAVPKCQGRRIRRQFCRANFSSVFTYEQALRCPIFFEILLRSHQFVDITVRPAPTLLNFVFKYSYVPPTLSELPYEQHPRCLNVWNYWYVPPIFPSIIVRTDCMLPKFERILVRPPHSVSLTVRTGSILPKLVRTWVRPPNLLAFVTHTGLMLTKCTSN